MFRLGETQELIVQKTVDFGVYLSREDAPEERVLLPKKQVPEGTTIGSKLEVFLYKDSQDRLIATEDCDGTVWCIEGDIGKQYRCLFGLGTGKGLIFAVQRAVGKSSGK